MVVSYCFTSFVMNLNSSVFWADHPLLRCNNVNYRETKAHVKKKFEFFAALSMHGTYWRFIDACGIITK